MWEHYFFSRPPLLQKNLGHFYPSHLPYSKWLARASEVSAIQKWLSILS